MSKSIMGSISQTEQLVLPNNQSDDGFCPLPGHTGSSIKDSVDTGFAIDGSLALKPDCKNPKLLQPLYKENFLSEFMTEEEQRQARHNLGLYDDKDVVAMSLITTGNKVSSADILDSLQIKTIKQGDVPIAVQTTAEAVMVKQEDSYISLQDFFKDYDSSVKKVNQRIDYLMNKSADGTSISTLGDINYFLKGFKNNESLLEITQNHLQFESKGTIEQKKWQI